MTNITLYPDDDHWGGGLLELICILLTKGKDYAN